MIADRTPDEMHPACIDAPREARLAYHRRAAAALRPRLVPGDRIRAVRGECGAKPATYTFAGWDGGWIVTASGIATIIPASVSRINGEAVNFMGPK